MCAYESSGDLDIYVHVPKNAGLSLLEQILKKYPLDKIYGYDPVSGRLSSMARQGVKPGQQERSAFAERIAAYIPGFFVRQVLNLRERCIGEEPERALEKAQVVIGHFAVNAFDGISTAENAQYFTVLRHPLERMDSHYRYLQQLGRLRPHIRHWSSGQNAKQSFASFAFDEQLQNYQSQFVGDNLARYAVVGITERFPAFLAARGLVEPGEGVPELNKAQWGQQSSLIHDPGFVRAFEEFHKEDYRLYYQANDVAP